MAWSMPGRTGRTVIAAIVIVVSLIAGLSAERADAALPAAEPDFLCASLWTRLLYYQPAGCTTWHQPLDLTAGPVTVCMDIRSGQMSLSNGGVCPAGRLPREIGIPSSTLACANLYTGAVTGRWSLNQACAGQPLDWVPTQVGIATCNNCPQATPDSGSTFGTLMFPNVAVGSGILDVNVDIDISHPTTSNLVLFLTSPSGTMLQLLGQNCGLDDDIMVTLDDESPNGQVGSVCPMNGIFQPEFGPLSIFDGENPSGIWTLQVVDIIAGDAGTLNDWSVTVEFS